MRQFSKFVLVLLAVQWLSACSWLRGDDNATPPAELTDIQSRATLVKIWERDVGAGIDEQFLRLRPAVAGGSVFAAERKGTVRAFNATDGKQLWESDTRISISSGVGVGESLVLVGSNDAEVVALDWRDGHEVWRTRVSSEVLAVPGADKGTVVVQSVDGKLTGLSATDGSRLWVYDRSAPVLSLRGTSSPVVTQGVVIAGADNGKLVVLDLAKGLPAWETSVAIPKGRSELERMVDIDSQPQIWGKTIYTVSYQGRAVALDGESGRVVWSRDMSSVAGMGVDINNVYVTDDASHVWSLDRDTGTSNWKQDKLANRTLTAPVSIGDYVAVADFEGYVHLLARSDGELAGRIRADSKGVLAPLVVDGDTLYVYGNGASLTAYHISAK